MSATSSSVRVSQAKLDDLLAGPRDPKRRTAEEGTITAVSVREGETVASGTVAVTIADLSRLQVETKELDESVVARVREGQDVAVIVTAFGRATVPVQVIGIGK